MAEQGVDISSPGWGADQFGAAVDVLGKQIASGQVRQVKGNSYKEDLVSGDAVAWIGWSGDITQLNAENDDKFAFAVPDSGGTIWSDNMMVPVGARHKANAEKLMNYYYDPEVAATVAAYVDYISPVAGAQEAMQRVDPSLVSDNQRSSPTPRRWRRSKIFRTLTPQEETDFGGAVPEDDRATDVAADLLAGAGVSVTSSWWASPSASARSSRSTSCH